MGAAVDDVHQRHRELVRHHAADIAVERHQVVLGRRAGDGKADTERGVGAEPALVRRAVELDQGGVDGVLVLGVHARERVEDLALDRGDRLQHAFAAVARHVAVAQLDRLVGAGRGAGRHGRAALCAGFEDDVDLDRWDCPGCRESRGHECR